MLVNIQRGAKHDTETRYWDNFSPTLGHSLVFDRLDRNEWETDTQTEID